MKLFASLIILFAVITSHAQTSNCTNATIRKEAGDFFFVLKKKNGAVEYVQDCLKAALIKDAETNKKEQTTKMRVLNLLHSMRQDEMAGYMKCITTDTPGCKETSQDEEDILAHEADIKNDGIQNDRETGSRDW